MAWVRGAWADALALGWGAAEGSLFFIVPDVLLTLTAAFDPRRSLRQLVLAIAGSVIAGLALFAWADARPDRAMDVVARVPFVRAEMFQRVEADFAGHGVWGLCRGPGSGIPYKVYAVAAPRYTGALPFALVSIPARAERLLITWMQFAATGWALRRWSRRSGRWLLGVHGVYWVLVYAWYWSRP
jgi:hypothetical protein